MQEIWNYLLCNGFSLDLGGVSTTIESSKVEIEGGFLPELGGVSCTVELSAFEEPMTSSLSMVQDFGLLVERFISDSNNNLTVTIENLFNLSPEAATWAEEDLQVQASKFFS